MRGESDLLRPQPCQLLRRCGIPSVVWFEDALKAYGVPTALFELYILVPNIEIAADVFEKNGWDRVPQQLGRVGNATMDLSIHPQVRLSPTNEDSEKDHSAPSPQAQSQSAPIPLKGYGTPSIVLLPASEWNFQFEKSAELTSHLPCLENLVDGLLDSMFDCSDLRVRDYLSMQLAYLYGHVTELQERAFAENLLYEHRQYHFDVLAGMTTGTIPFVAHQLNIRDALRKGTFNLRECSASRENEELFDDRVRARLLASLPPAGGQDPDSAGE